MAAKTFTRVYLWEWPVRLYHWFNAMCLLVLIPTGLLIGHPPALMSSGDASAYWFGWVRFLHFSAAFVFLYVFLVRLYWMFAGNRYARWTNFIPVGRGRLVAHVKEMFAVLRVDILQVQRKPVDYLGHNALASSSYLALYVATVIMVATGFGLYAPMSQSHVAHLFAWVVPLMGGDASVRQWHHATTWFFVIFTMVHVHLAMYHDYVEGHGEISSMTSGSRFIERE
jgi:Ni/Fe-hydrogenase 1 B-type cytochrome subunit